MTDSRNGQKKMSYPQVIVSKVPRPSRNFQISMLKALQERFQQIIQLPYRAGKQSGQHLQLSKQLLIDIRHVILYHTFDYDIKKQLMQNTNSIIAYIQAFMQSIALKNQYYKHAHMKEVREIGY